MAFVTSSSYIYINGFGGLSGQTYSYYFALNALDMIPGPALYMHLTRRIDRKSIIIAGFAVILLPATLFSSCVRSPSANLTLEQQEDTGSAASLMSFIGIFTGSMEIVIISLNWGDTILALGAAMDMIAELPCEALWRLLSRKTFIKQIQETMGSAIHT
jgi:DHA1 family bicyclomycin/chloramphenicol resistance-like MFS transporter